jgi:hypothetical protein
MKGATDEQIAHLKLVPLQSPTVLALIAKIEELEERVDDLEAETGTGKRR